MHYLETAPFLLTVSPVWKFSVVMLIRMALMKGQKISPTMITAIQQGLTQATMAQVPYKMGQMAIKDANLIIGGQGSQVPALQLQDAVLVTSENAKSVNPVDFYGPNVK